MIPVLTVAIEPKRPEDRGLLRAALRLLGDEVVVQDDDAGIVLGGADEMQLDDVVSGLAQKVPIAVRPLEIAYRETITRKVEHDYTHKKRIGEIGQFARIKFRIEPAGRGEGIVFVSEVPAGNLPEDFVVGVELGLEALCAKPRTKAWVLPVTDIRFTLEDGAYHDQDSSTLAFRIAAEAAFLEAFEKAKPAFLEPIMTVEVTSPVNVGEIVADLNARRGEVRSVAENGPSVTIGAMVPLANLLGYTTSLRRLSAGVARYTLAFSHYERAPGGLDPDDRFRPAMAMRA
jgi:elongation factor G